MPNNLFESVVLANELRASVEEATTPCQPRLLIVTDGSLDFSAGAFGLARFVEALHGYWLPLSITLAHRNLAAHNVRIGTTSYRVIGGFNFARADTPVTIDNYDQIWLFGFAAGPNPPDPGFPISADEIRTIANFMNQGGGVFATGDHGRLGQGMCGNLPRIRHMRDWSSIPMGSEGNRTARNRIDTVVNPGENAIYEFDDQSDDVPQRIYPNSTVTWFVDMWTSSIHPLLRLPGAPFHPKDAFRVGFEVDVLPDHPHESVCLEVSPTSNIGALTGSFQLAGLKFNEFPPTFLGDRLVGSDIVAYGVSAGRALVVGALSPTAFFKPPVNPRMFGIISAFDGHITFGLQGTRPGRIVCDSTWHHFVNTNLDGSGTSRTGLGTGAGDQWVPSAACRKIFRYYHNIVSWLQPAARQRCRAYVILLLLRFNVSLIEELAGDPAERTPGFFEGLGVEARRLIDEAEGPGTAAEAVRAALRLDEATAALADSGEAEQVWNDPSTAEPIVAHALGRALAELAEALPVGQPREIKKSLSRKGHDRLEGGVSATIAAAVGEGLALQIRRGEERQARLAALAPRAAPKGGSKPRAG